MVAVARARGREAFQDVAPPVIDPDGPGRQPPGPASIFCSGHSLLPSGEVVVAGGDARSYARTLPDDAYTDWAGLQTIFTFDPFSETWTRQPDMAEGRWYPASGPASRWTHDHRRRPHGNEPPGGLQDREPRGLQPAGDDRRSGLRRAEAERRPHWIRSLPPLVRASRRQPPDGRPEQAAGRGPRHVGTSRGTRARRAMSLQRLAGNVVRRPGGPSGSDTVTALGGFNRPGVTGPFYPATADFRDDRRKSDRSRLEGRRSVQRRAGQLRTPSCSRTARWWWSEVAAASNRETPTKQATAAATRPTPMGARAKSSSIDPDTNSWRLGPAQQEDRTYHSTAVLLPDGRVFSAGDDRHPTESGGGRSLIDNGEIYSPPYLFKGARPADRAPPPRRSTGVTPSESKVMSTGIDRAVLDGPPGDHPRRST